MMLKKGRYSVSRRGWGYCLKTNSRTFTWPEAVFFTFCACLSWLWILKSFSPRSQSVATFFVRQESPSDFEIMWLTYLMCNKIDYWRDSMAQWTTWARNVAEALRKISDLQNWLFIPGHIGPGNQHSVEFQENQETIWFSIFFQKIRSIQVAEVLVGILIYYWRFDS